MARTCVFGRRRSLRRPPAAGQRAAAPGDNRHSCDRSAVHLQSHVAHGQIFRAPRPPSAAVSTRLPAESGISSSRSLARRASRGCRGHARHPLGAHAPGASASPGAADGRSVRERSNAILGCLLAP
eukprot:4716862-Prymnesium_polylepis.1